MLGLLQLLKNDLWEKKKWFDNQNHKCLSLYKTLIWSQMTLVFSINTLDLTVWGDVHVIPISLTLFLFLQEFHF